MFASALSPPIELRATVVVETSLGSGLARGSDLVGGFIANGHLRVGTADCGVAVHGSYRSGTVTVARYVGILAIATVLALAGLPVSNHATPTLADSPTPLSLGPVTGTFYPNPAGSGSFDASQLSNPAFTETFSVINFDPPQAAQATCSSQTGINEFTRPFTDVIPAANGSCTTQVVEGNGLQAGSGPLYAFEAVFTSNLTVASAGNVSFNFYSDDGWILAAGPVVGGSAQPTYVSGSLLQAPPAGEATGYQIVGSYNVPSSPTQNVVTVSFPTAGTYPIEIDYTECCGGQLSLLLGSSFSNPIPAFCSPWADETEMIQDMSACRNTFIIDPGVGNLISRNLLLENAAFLMSKGFTQNFLWYAPEVVQSEDTSVQWSDCQAPYHRDTNSACTSNVGFIPMYEAFTGSSVSLHLFAYGNSFIGRGCGNYSLDQSANPVPTISGHKFNDLNGNGVWDSGEPGLGGWTMELRDSGGSVVQTTTTDANGAYQFSLDGLGPETYAVTEQSQGGWSPTLAPGPVVVGYGVGNQDFGGNDFGNVQAATPTASVPGTTPTPPPPTPTSGPPDVTPTASGGTPTSPSASPTPASSNLSVGGTTNLTLRPAAATASVQSHTSRDRWTMAVEVLFVVSISPLFVVVWLRERRRSR